MNNVARDGLAPALPSAWKTILGTIAGIVLGLLFISSGAWKLIEPFEWASRVVQAKAPAPLGLPLAIGVGITETFGGVLLLIPAFRRWGSWITAFLLVVFMAWFGWFYKELTGADCSCFPWLKRTVGPGFFIGDGAMLVLAAIGGWTARRSENLRGAAVVLSAVSVFAIASFGINYARQTGAPAPDSITVDNAPYSLRTGRIFVYFYDPECSHCLDAGKKMAAYKWAPDVVLIGQPTVNPQFAKFFVEDTGLKGKIRTAGDLGKLKSAFPFTNGPFAVAIENGRQKAEFRMFEGSEPQKSLRELGYVQ